MLGTFPKAFPKWEFYKGIFPISNFPNVQFPERQLHESALAAALGPLACSSWSTRPLALLSHSAQPHFSLRLLRRPNVTLVSVSEISHLRNCHLGSCPWENAFYKIPNRSIFKENYRTHICTWQSAFISHPFWQTSKVVS